MALHPSSHKAGKILRDGEIRGRKLTSKQRGFFGARAGGKRPNRLDEAQIAVARATA